VGNENEILKFREIFAQKPADRNDTAISLQEMLSHLYIGKSQELLHKYLTQKTTVRVRRFWE